jgi:hypothetical protein
MGRAFSIRPYCEDGIWMFDDPAVGLVGEALVQGIDRMIEDITKDFADPASGFRLLFSDEPFPGNQIELEWVRPDESGGNWYFCPQLGYQGWLCPALLLYFPTPPRTIYCRAEPLPEGRPSPEPRPPAEEGDLPW